MFLFHGLLRKVFCSFGAIELLKGKVPPELGIRRQTLFRFHVFYPCFEPPPNFVVGSYLVNVTA